MWKRLRRRAGAALVQVTCALALVAAADARDVTFPIRLDDRFLTLELARTAYVDPGATARVFDDGSGCNSLVLFDPKVTTEPGGLRVRSAGEARFGVAAGGRCLLPLSWSGQIELVEEPRIEPGVPIVRFDVVDSRILDEDGSEPLVSGTLWGWMKEYVHPRLETRIDLQQPVDQLRALLPTFGVAAPGSALDGALASLALAGVELSAGTVAVQVRLEVPERVASATASPGSEPVAPLSAEEILRWQQALHQWDAFLTFVVKVTGSDTQIAELRRTLLNILLDERYALTEALASPDASVHDPVRPLFLRTWARLAPALRQVANALPADQAVRYLSFVSAGDALQALDRLGPESGIEISADGLRRLARLVAPASLDDPLAYGVEVDPELRALFGFGPPLPAPEDNPDVDTEAAPESSAEATPDASPDPSPEPSLAPSPRSLAPSPGSLDPSPESLEPSPDASPEPSPSSWLWLWLGGTAWAAEPGDPALVKRLNAWAPTRADVAEYAPLAGRLLDSVTTFLLARHDIDPAHERVFRALVPATAWQESCWRQYVRRSGRLTALTSGAGAVGIMQVNVAVWRGFYEVAGLKRDIAYNARAGGEILSRYWTDYAVPRGEQQKGGGVDALARATYAAYNGGPGELTRYRARGRSKRERAVDGDFLVKYQRMKSGDALAVVECFTD